MKYLIILVSLVSMNVIPLKAQYMMTGKEKTYIVNINNPDGYTRLTVLSKKSNIKPHIEYIYYWYAFGRIMTTVGRYNGRLLNGEYASFYENNDLEEKGYFKKGLKTGEWISWYEDGNLKEISHWKNSLKEGNRKVYNENGELESEENYKNGKACESKKENKNIWTIFKELVDKRRVRKTNDTNSVNR